MTPERAVPRLLTVEQAAEALALKPSTIRAWILYRRLAVVRPGGRSVRVPVSEVERIITEGLTPARPLTDRTRAV